MEPTLCANEKCTNGDNGSRKLIENPKANQLYCNLRCNQNASATRRREAAGDPTPQVKSYTTEEMEGIIRQNEELKRIHKRLNADLVKYRDRQAALVEATLEAATDAMLSYGPYTPSLAPSHLAGGHNHSPEAAIWHLTDWQGSKLTTTYNTTVMEERVRRFLKKANGITEIQRADHPVDECYILLGGDMIEGLFNFPTQAFEIDQTLFDQMISVSRLLVEATQYALSVYPKVTVIGEWGNHGRLGSKRDNVPRYDNADRMTYQLARNLLQGEARLTWENGPEDIQRVEIGNYRALLIHGDEVGRNGYASPSTIVNHVNGWRSGAYRWDFRDVYMGHYHTHAEWPMRNGEGHVYQTGSIESDNRYALVQLAATATPSQRVHFVDKKKGRISAQYQIWVDDELDTSSGAE